MTLRDFGYKFDFEKVDVCSSFEEAEQKDIREQWSLSPAERLRQAEYLRQIAFSPMDYDPATSRVLRVLEVAELERR